MKKYKPYKPVSFWKPMKIKSVKIKSNSNSLFSFKPVKSVKPINLKSQFNSISPVNLKMYPARTKSEWRLIDKKPFGDRDKDRVPNWFDCRPLNKKKQAKIGVVGSRKGTIKQKELLEKHLNKSFNKAEDCLVSGGCYAGADKWAKDWALKNKAKIIEHLPKGYSPQDFHNRNKLIAQDSDRLIGIVVEGANPNRFAGTEQTIREAKERGIPTKIVTPTEIIEYENNELVTRKPWENDNEYDEQGGFFSKFKMDKRGTLGRTANYQYMINTKNAISEEKENIMQQVIQKTMQQIKQEQEYRQRPEVKERQQKLQQTPEFKERQRKHRQTPEYKKQRREHRYRKHTLEKLKELNLFSQLSPEDLLSLEQKTIDKAIQKSLKQKRKDKAIQKSEYQHIYQKEYRKKMKEKQTIQKIEEEAEKKPLKEILENKELAPAQKLIDDLNYDDFSSQDVVENMIESEPKLSLTSEAVETMESMPEIKTSMEKSAQELIDE